MPKESGLEFAGRLRECGRDMRIVFVTSHKEYSLPAFDVYAFDYIVKPVNQARLHHTVLRALSETSSVKGSVEHDSSSMRVLFNCLGGMEIRMGQNELVKWKTSKSAELFGYLLMHKGRLVSRASQSISFVSDSSYYALELNHVSVDMLQFEEGYKQIAVVDDIHIEQALELEQLYAGDLFGDRAFPWAWSEVERFRLMYTAFTHRLCRAMLNKGDTQTAIRLITKLTAHNELDEETIKLYMKALALQNNKEALKRQYLHYTDTLYQELGIRPSPDVAGFYRQLLAELDSQNIVR